MKTILVATDFSEAAHNAAVYAAALAKAFNARLLLFSAYEQVPVPVSEIPVLSQEEMGMRVQQDLEDEKQVLIREYEISVETMSKPGLAAKCILHTVSENKADLIVAGLKEADVTIRRLFGSTVTALIKKLPVPLLVVPEKTSFVNISTIALATERDAELNSDPYILDSLREIGERFHSKLYLVRVAKSQLVEAYEALNRPFMLSKMARTLNPLYKCVEGKNIPEALNTFISEYHVNLLGILPHEHHFLQRLYHTSITRSMVFESRIPLLILPEMHKQFEAGNEDW